MTIGLVTFFWIPLSFAHIHYPDVSQNKTAQALFDKGMEYYYAYLYVQAEYNFRQALIYDAVCAMCHWGIALAKKQQALELSQPFARLGYEDIQRARHYLTSKHEFYQDILNAAVHTFSLDPKTSNQQLQSQYIHSLRLVYQKYQHQRAWRQESLALLVDAMLYDIYNGYEAALNHCGAASLSGYRQEALRLVRPILIDPSYPDHPGLLHFYIHLAERDTQDPLALTAAEKLPHFSQKLISHYTHMPTHIYWRRGMYQQAIAANLAAIAIDQHYFKQGGIGLNTYYYEYHYLHAYHFLTALGILTHDFALAVNYAHAAKQQMDESRIAMLKDYRDTLFSLEHVVLAYFYQWEAVLKLERPAEIDELGILMIDFTQALAYLNQGKKTSFQSLYQHIAEQTYHREMMNDLQTLILSYLQASVLSLQQASFKKIEAIFIKNKVSNIEEKLSVLNPPLWFFYHQQFLSNLVVKR